MRQILLAVVAAFFLQPRIVYADFFGGDLPMLASIVANTAQQLTKLQAVIGTGQENLQLMKDINRGLQKAMDIMRTQNGSLSPGVLSDLQNVSQMLDAVERLYGKVPNTPQADLQSTTDASIAQSIHLHNEAFRYADKVDPEAEKLKDYARGVSPLGAQKLTAQGVGVLIHVMNQVLRTNAAILKIQSEQLALQNRKDKLGSQQLKTKYSEISKALKADLPQYGLVNLKF
jgi:hypothetical protein